MANGTTLNAGSGGNTLFDEDLGGGVHMPTTKIHVGDAVGTDSGPVGPNNPIVAGGTFNTGAVTLANANKGTLQLGAGGALVTSTGGRLTAAIAANSNTAVKATAGRLARVLVTSAGTGSGNVTIYDNASAASGTVIGILPATVSVTGVPFVFDLPAANGIYVVNPASGPGITVSYD